MIKHIYAWSDSSQYLVIADTSGNKLSISDMKTGKSEEVALNKKIVEMDTASLKGKVVFEP